MVAPYGRYTISLGEQQYAKHSSVFFAHSWTPYFCNINTFVGSSNLVIYMGVKQANGFILKPMYICTDFFKVIACIWTPHLWKNWIFQKCVACQFEPLLIKGANMFKELCRGNFAFATWFVKCELQNFDFEYFTHKHINYISWIKTRFVSKHRFSIKLG